MSKAISLFARCFLPLCIVCLPFFAAFAYSGNILMEAMTITVAAVAAIVYKNKYHRIEFNPRSKTQKSVFVCTGVVLIVFCLFLCSVSIEKEWLYEYPLEGSVDDYGCYPQMFDAFQKGQLNIDTEYDLSKIEALNNPYDYYERRAATQEHTGVFWDRAFYNGKLYSYFGVAPIFLIYYPAYFLTGFVLSDALAAAALSGLTCIVFLMLVWELFRNTKSKPPFILVLLGGITLCFGSLIFPTLTNANFYHIAVLSGILTVSAFFLFGLKAVRAEDGRRRKALFAISGVSAAAIVASRPNLAIYALIALPMIVSVIKKRENGGRSLALDAVAFAVPTVLIGSLVMVYNNARFGSPFDFGATYQLTVTDISTYSFSPALLVPSMYHYFAASPDFDGIFPYLHMAKREFAEYAVDRAVYVSKTVGSVYFPVTWGGLLFPLLRRNSLKLVTAAITLFCVFFIAFFDMCFAGVHLRYAADIMFVLCILGIYMLIYAVSKTKKGSGLYVGLYSATVALFAMTVPITLALCLDNERDMIYHYHREFYNFISTAVS